MAGFVQPQFNEKPVGDLLTLLTNGVGTPPKSVLKWRCFGDKIAPITGDIDSFSKPAVFSKPTASPCGNQTSRVDKVLAEVRKQPVGSLTLIVSDLWLDGNEMAADPAVALGVPLKAMLEEGRAVAILGVEAPFKGKITGVPGLGGGSFAGATKRPLFILAVGPETDLVRLVQGLRGSGAPSFSGKRLNVALFRGRGGPRNVPLPTTMGGGVSGNPGAYQIDKQLFAEQQGRLERVVAGRERLLPGTIWQGPLTGTALVELQTKQGGWQLLSKPLPVWWEANDKRSLQFRLDAASLKGLPAGSYRVTALMGNKGLARPNPDTKWLRDWSLSPSEKPQPGFVKALQLAVLADILEAGDDQLARQVPFGKKGSVELPFRPNQLFQFNLKVKE
ncbi:hypothetical protein [Sandarakinorhabdus rubra]|uniref:hypothetical protein n=1 Tax=Sandarakinorhabdus rubra TaxID=2672568 RepID=UPI0013DB86C7|nr:hypothetical protein [Sandarakinorhabdus rubra]